MKSFVVLGCGFSRAEQELVFGELPVLAKPLWEIRWFEVTFRPEELVLLCTYFSMPGMKKNMTKVLEACIGRKLCVFEVTATHQVEVAHELHCQFVSYASRTMKTPLSKRVWHIIHVSALHEIDRDRALFRMKRSH